MTLFSGEEDILTVPLWQDESSPLAIWPLSDVSGHSGAGSVADGSWALRMSATVPAPVEAQVPAPVEAQVPAPVEAPVPVAAPAAPQLAPLPPQNSPRPAGIMALWWRTPCGTARYLRPHALDLPTTSKAMRARMKALRQEHGRNIACGYTLMTRAQRRDWLQAWMGGDLAACYQIESRIAARSVPATHPGHPDFVGAHWVIWAPAVPTEIPAGVFIPGNWPSAESTWPAGAVHTYLWAARMAHPERLSPGERRQWARAHLRGDKVTVDALSLQAAQRVSHGGAGDPAAPHGPQPFTAPDEDYRSYLDAQTPPGAWGVGALRCYATDRMLPDAPRHSALVRMVAQQLGVDAVAAARAARTLVLRRAPVQPELGGYHPKLLLRDQHGREWLFKPAPAPDAPFRSEVEHAAHQLARSCGYPCAASRLVSFEGRYGQAQAWLAVAYSLHGFSGASFATLRPAQLCAIAREHLLDWLLDNDDTHGHNIVVLHDGTVVGIDKGRAWRYVGAWPGLCPDARANTNAPLIYTSLYRAIAAHQLPRDTVDAMFRDVILTAHRMQRLPDGDLGALISAGVAHRPHYRPSSYQQPVPGAPTNAAELITQVTARKNALVADMHTLWTAVYAAAGWEPPAVSVPTLGVNPQGHPLYAGLHEPELHQAVAATKSYGTSTFFAGVDLEDAHLLLWRERRADGSFLVRVQGKVRGAAMTRLGTWCRVHTAAPPGVPLSTVPGEQVLYDAIIAGARTISHHREDKQYNALKLAGLAQARAALLAIAERNQGSPGDDVAGMCALYLAHIERIYRHQSEGTASVVGDFPPYTPQPAVRATAPVRATLAPAQREAASLAEAPCLDPDGELRLCGKRLENTTTEVRGQPGSRYLIELPDGESIEFRGAEDTATPRAYQGLLTLSIPEPATMPASLRALQNQLATMGLDLMPATATDLELFYWRHLDGILHERYDTLPGAEEGPAARFHQRRPSAPITEAHEELAAWRDAFAAFTSPEQIAAFLAADAHLPRFLHMDTFAPKRPTGHPYWERFDATVATVITKAMPALVYRSGPRNVVLTGAALSTEDRVQQLAIWKSGMSSLDDMAYGSSAFVFTRQNQEGTGFSSHNIFFNPRVLLRTSNYAMGEDHFGRTHRRVEHSPWSLCASSAFWHTNNELMIKHALSLLDDVEVLVFASASDRERAITMLAARGVATIRGLPVSTRFVLARSRAAVQAALAAARAAFTPPATR